MLRLADGRSESVGETRARYLVWSQGLPPPEVNYPIFDEHGARWPRVDLAWPEFGLFLEFDGKVKYERLLKEGESASDVVFREKQREDMICRLTGGAASGSCGLTSTQPAGDRRPDPRDVPSGRRLTSHLSWLS